MFYCVIIMLSLSQHGHRMSQRVFCHLCILDYSSSRNVEAHSGNFGYRPNSLPSNKQVDRYSHATRSCGSAKVDKTDSAAPLNHRLMQDGPSPFRTDEINLLNAVGCVFCCCFASEAPPIGPVRGYWFRSISGAARTCFE